jgi:hypothetical protein
LRHVLLATGDDRTRNHYSCLDESLAAVARQKFNNVFTEVCLLVSYIGAADVYTAFEAELQDQTSTQYAEFFKVIQGSGANRVTANSASRRQYILTQAVRGMFGEDSEGSLHKKHHGQVWPGLIKDSSASLPVAKGARTCAVRNHRERSRELPSVC